MLTPIGHAGIMPAARCGVREMLYRRRRIVLTGAWGGGKSTFMKEIQADRRISRQVLMLPEAAPLVRRMGFDVASPAFEGLVVRSQHALETLADTRDGEDDRRAVLTHRGSLDALAFWRLAGRAIADFFRLTASSHEAEMARYDAVLLFETTAGSLPEVYEEYRESQPRPPAAEAVRLDRLLQECWGAHRRFFRVTNPGLSWPEKAACASAILDACLRDGDGAMTAA